VFVIVVPIWLWLIGQHSAALTFFICVAFGALGGLSERQKRRRS
jgi:hypothetical protein